MQKYKEKMELNSKKRWVIQMTKSENFVILKTTTVQQFVEHPEFGKGKPILKSHAIPDDNGNVSGMTYNSNMVSKKKLWQKI